MVRVYRCHSFASQRVIPIENEPLAICAADNKVFVATSDCEIIVFEISDGTLIETQRCPTISLVEKITFNSFRNYIATIELKKSWMRVTKSVRVYLNWQTSTPGSIKPRTKVRVAGKSYVQHATGLSNSDLLEIVEVPLDENATSVAVCKYTGNFAVACGSEVKLCSVVEKAVANSGSPYLDVEVFLELCWNFQVLSISLCEEFIICCSQKEVHGIKVRYEEGEKKHHKGLPALLAGLSASSQELSTGRSHSTEHQKAHYSESFPGHRNEGRQVSVSPLYKPSSGESILQTKECSDTLLPRNDISVGRKQSTHHTFPHTNIPNIAETPGSVIVDDENFVEWNFQQGGSMSASTSVCLPGLHTSSTKSHCYHHAHIVSPPVLLDSAGGKVRSFSGVHAETILHLSDPQEKEEWKSVTLIPTHSSEMTKPGVISSMSTDRMRSVSRPQRTSMCCYISGTRGGYLYQISPLLAQVSSYMYTDKALEVGVSQNFLHVVTSTGIETYTSRWGAVSLEMQEREKNEPESEQIHPPSSLDICLCGHEPFVGTVSLSAGADFLAVLSKVEDPLSSEVHWSVYVLQTFNLIDLYRDMMTFADKIKITGPASFIHLLQEAHLLLSTNPQFTAAKNSEVSNCHRQVCWRLGEYYSQYVYF